MPAIKSRSVKTQKMFEVFNDALKELGYSQKDAGKLYLTAAMSLLHLDRSADSPSEFRDDTDKAITALKNR